MIDTSKAVRPCVEELAAQLNLGIKPQAVKPLFHWWDVKDCFKATTTVNGVTITNNDDGTFSLHGTCTRQSAFQMVQTEIPLNLQTLIPRVRYISGSGFTTWYTCIIITMTDVLNTINPPVGTGIIGYTKTTFSVNGESHQNTVPTISSNFLDASTALAYIYSTLSGDHTNESFEYYSTSIGSLALSLRPGEYNTKFSFNCVDLGAYANIDTFEALLNKTSNVDDKINLYDALNIRTLIDQTKFENAMWKFTNANFNIEYSNDEPTMAGGKYFTIGSNS